MSPTPADPAAPPASAIDEALDRARVVVCVGTGGVGKTTIAAALALEAARRGRRTLVLTIDPARRLANAFGLEALGPEPVRIALALAPEAGPPGAGEAFLEIMMLETRHAFDQLVHRLAPDAATRRRILENRIYRQLADALAGSSEYAAMAEVQALVDAGRHDLVVVDTPPAEHALDFLRAPERLEAFLASRFFHALVRPAMSASRLSLRLFARPLHRALSLIERIAGLGFLEDLTELLRAIDGLADALAARARRAREVLFGAETRFVLVCRALPGAERTTASVMAEFDALGAPLRAVVVNRVQPWTAPTSPARLQERWDGEEFAHDLRALAEGLEPPADGADPARAAAGIAAALLEYTRMCSAERRRIEAIGEAARARGIELASVPERSEPLDRLEGLQGLSRALTAAGTRR